MNKKARKVKHKEREGKREKVTERDGEVVEREREMGREGEKEKMKEKDGEVIKREKRGGRGREVRERQTDRQVGSETEGSR